MSTPNPIVFPPIVQGFSWSPSTTDPTGAPLPSGETESGVTIGIRMDGDAAHGVGNYQWFIVVPSTQASATLIFINAAIGKNLVPGNYWAALDQTDMLAGSPSTSAWTQELKFSVPTPVPVIVKPAPPGNFGVA